MVSKVPIIPVYTNGSYYKKSRAKIIIGKQIKVEDLLDENLSEKENIEKLNKYLRDKIIELGEQLNEKQKSKR